jgi:hypothetical protein
MVRHLARRITLATLVATLLVASVASGALAAKPPRGGASATLYASCSPCAVGSVVDFWGSGYDARQGKAMLNIGGAVTSTAVDANGNIRFSWPYFSAAGSYPVSVYQWSRSGKPVLKAQLTVLVQ